MQVRCDPRTLRLNHCIVSCGDETGNLAPCSVVGSKLETGAFCLRGTSSPRNSFQVLLVVGNCTSLCKMGFIMRNQDCFIEPKERMETVRTRSFISASLDISLYSPCRLLFTVFSICVSQSSLEE